MSVCVLLQLQEEFLRITKIDVVKALTGFWVESRVDTALRRLAGDKLARPFLDGLGDTNIFGTFSDDTHFADLFTHHRCCLLMGDILMKITILFSSVLSVIDYL